jgi:Protein of unknown function (DUF2934)
MKTKHSENPLRRGPTLGALAEGAIVESLEREHWAEGVSLVDPELRHEMIATAAYYISEQRGFAPGHEREDWYRAEAAIDKQLPRLLKQR